MADGYYQNKTKLLDQLLRDAIPALQDPGDNFGFTMPDGKYHIFIYVDDPDELLYVIEPNRVEDGAHEPFVGDTYLAAHGDYADLLLGCLWSMECFEEDIRKQLKPALASRITSAEQRTINPTAAVHPNQINHTR